MDAQPPPAPPVDNLPPELLTRIFLLSCGERPFNVNARGPLYKSGQVVVTHVCSYWRQVALSSSELWSSFTCQGFVVIGGGTQEIEDSLKTRLREILRRSGDRCLTMDIDESGGNEFLHVIVAHASRWESLRLHCSNSSLLHLKNIDVYPQLTTLYLSFSREDWGEELVLNAPLLRVLHLSDDGELSGTARYAARNKPAFPWKQLTHLELKTSRIQDIVDVLSQCPNLVSFKDLDPISAYPELIADTARIAASTDEVIVLPSLEHITVCIPALVLPHLTCPSLHTFTIQGLLDWIQDSDHMDDLYAFLTRSHCDIRHLVYRPTQTFEQLYGEFRILIARLSPTVETLELDLLRSDAQEDMIIDGLRFNPLSEAAIHEDNARYAWKTDAMLASELLVPFPHVRDLVIKLDVSSLTATQPRDAYEPWPVRPDFITTFQERLVEIIDVRWDVPTGERTFSKLRSLRIEFNTGGEGHGDDEAAVKTILESRLFKRLREYRDEGLAVSIFAGVPRRCIF